MAKAHNDVSVNVPPLKSNRRWTKWEEFEEDFASYLKENWLIYRKRSNVKTKTNNTSLTAGKYAYVTFPVSEKKFAYVYRQYYCTHGCFDGPKGKGARVQTSYRFTGCQARIFALVDRDDKGNMFIKTRNEVFEHNHRISEDIYKTLMRGISVCEMLVANQQAQTIRECLAFFKRVVGKAITESITIDKDFTEWRVLEQLLPDTKIRW
ncbi:hypothetical protein PR001_g16900 [Phytophthora rubi]|uniref:ZSWIM1/3 RNaseH-like domain-containing protein n=1 Tax=Phytophthora rubi TaxID=129364 RepID=A0A6A3KLD4_9STRA|nr:hypothetical protein PR001_g16900 [Phytophthora rubi]